MANAPLSLNIEYFSDDLTGKPLTNASVWIGTPDLDPEIEANRVDVIITQEDGTEVTITPSLQPLTTVAGRINYVGNPVSIQVDGTYSIKVRDTNERQVYYAPRANEVDVTPTDTGVVLLNGSFEIETVTNLSDNWTFAATTTGSVSPDSTSQAHGLKSLKFISVDTTGAGIATSDKFDTAENTDFDVRFIYKSSNATTLNKVEVKFYNAAGAPVSTVTAYSNGTTNPLTYTPHFARITAPALGVEAQVILTGVDAAGTTKTGNTNFDGLRIDYANPVIESVNVDDAVNSISISDAITGVNPSIDVSGEDVGLDIEGITLKNETLKASTANADLELTRNGTGDITIDTIPVYGLVILDTPEEIAPATLTHDAWTTVNSTTLNTAGATKAILKCFLGTSKSSVTSLFSSMYIRKTGSALVADGLTLAAINNEYSVSAASLLTRNMTEMTVNLDGSSDFDYYYSTTATLGGDTSNIVLVGYYV